MGKILPFPRHKRPVKRALGKMRDNKDACQILLFNGVFVEYHESCTGARGANPPPITTAKSRSDRKRTAR